jgi:uncharacterized membrane protein
MQLVKSERRDQNSFVPSWTLPPTWLKFLIIVLCCLGLFFRFTNLDGKIYWYDETHTSLRVSGYSEAEAVQSLSTSQVIRIAELHKYQHPNPGRGVTDIVKNFASEDAQHPPLYYLIMRFWMQWFGSSVAAARSLSALLSLLAFPCIYWLCLELYKSPLVGWIAVAMLAISPVHVLYAQEARQYSFWTVTILLSSAALLRAIRRNTKVSWGIYAATAVLSLYTFLFSGLVLVGHGIYVAVTERFRLSKKAIAYLVASVSALVAFIPWIVAVSGSLSRIEKTTAWTANKLTFSTLIREWVLIIDRIFVDWNYPSDERFISKILFYLSSVILLGVLAYSIYFLCRHTPKEVWLFNVILIASTGLSLMLSDLLGGGMRSTIVRYLFPYYVGIQLTVVYLLGAKVTGVFANIKQQKFWQVVTLAIISAGVVSCAISSHSQVWWSKYQNQCIPEVARIINQATRPLLISNTQTGDLLALSYQLDPKVGLLIEPLCTNCGVTYDSRVEPDIRIPQEFSDIFFFNLDGQDKWLNTLAKNQNYKVEKIDLASRKSGSLLWKLSQIQRNTIES